jgi:dextranase
VGYENLLRGGGAYNTPDVSTYGEVTLNQWPPQQGKVSVVGKAVGKREVIHLLNFTDATTMNWRDNNGIQAYPYRKNNIPIVFSTDQQVQKVWYATPDHEMGASRKLEFTQSGSEVTFTLPSLKYWSMVVIEFK